MTRRADRAHVICRVDVFVFGAMLIGMSQQQHQSSKSRKHKSVTSSNGIIPVVRHSAPTLAPAPQPTPVVAHVATSVAAPKQEQHATPAVIQVVQQDAASEQATQKAPTSRRRSRTRKRTKATTPVVAAPTMPIVATPVLAVPIAAAVSVQVPQQTELSYVQALAPTHAANAPSTATVPVAKTQERSVKAPRAARGRVKEPLRWAFTYADVAAAAGVSVDRVRHASARIGGREPSLVMTDLRSVARFIEGRRLRAAT